jgi:hypothetical protein
MFQSDSSTSFQTGVETFVVCSEGRMSQRRLVSKFQVFSDALIWRGVIG